MHSTWQAECLAYNGSYLTGNELKRCKASASLAHLVNSIRDIWRSSLLKIERMP
jgi:hypothetical protein